jgi:hypothetical protein
VIAGGRSVYATWWEANEQDGAELTEMAIRRPGDTDRDRDERDDMTMLPSDGPTTPKMPPDEALAVLRHGVRDEVEQRAVSVLGDELARLRERRRAALALATAVEQRAWSNGGSHAIRAIVRELREALGLKR